MKTMKNWYDKHIIQSAVTEGYLNRLSAKQLYGHIITVLLDGVRQGYGAVDDSYIAELLKRLLLKGETQVGAHILEEMQRWLTNDNNGSLSIWNKYNEADKQRMLQDAKLHLRSIMQAHFTEFNALRESIKPPAVKTDVKTDVKTAGVVKQSLPLAEVEALVLSVVPAEVVSAYRELQETRANITEWWQHHQTDSFDVKMKKHMDATLAAAEHDLERALNGAPDIFMYTRNLMAKRVRDQLPIPVWARQVFGLRLPSNYKRVGTELRVVV